MYLFLAFPISNTPPDKSCLTNLCSKLCTNHLGLADHRHEDVFPLRSTEYLVDDSLTFADQIDPGRRLTRLPMEAIGKEALSAARPQGQNWGSYSSEYSSGSDIIDHETSSFLDTSFLQRKPLMRLQSVAYPAPTSPGIDCLPINPKLALPTSVTHLNAGLFARVLGRVYSSPNRQVRPRIDLHV